VKDKGNDIDKLFSDKLASDRHYQIPEAFTNDLNNRMAERKGNSSRKGLWIFSSLLLIAIISSILFYPIADGGESSSQNLADNTSSFEDSLGVNTEMTQISPEDENGHNQITQEKNSPTELINDNLDTDYSSTNNIGGSNQTTSNTSNSHLDKTNDLSSSTNFSSTQDESIDLKRKNTGNGTKTSDNVDLSNGSKEKDSANSNDSYDSSSNSDNSSNNTGTKDGISKINSQDGNSSTNNDSESNSTQNNKTNLEENQDSANNEDQGNKLDGSTSIDSTITNHEEEITLESSSDTTDRGEDLVQNQESETDSTQNPEANDLAEIDSLTSITPEVEINSDPKPKKFNFELQAYGGADLVSANFISALQEDQDAYNSVNLRKLSAIYGIGANMNFNRMFAGIGVSLYKFSDEVNFTSYDYSSSTIDSVTTTFVLDSVAYDTNGFPVDSFYITQYDTTTYTINDSSLVNNNTINTYKILSIPVSFGYSFELNKWAIRPRVSAIFELTRQSIVGNYPISTNNNTLEQLQSLKFGMSLGLELQVQRNFGNFYAFARPGYRMRLNSTAGNGSSSIKHNAFSAVLGFGYYFGKD
jgi:hypothetical protein